MDLFEVIISPEALDALEAYVDYIQYTLLDDFAANAVYKDAIETGERLSVVAGSLKLCDDVRLREYGYRKILFRRHRYVMLYRIEGTKVYVDGIFHQIQDYENLFAEAKGWEAP